ncbi:AlkA N-terminal domain-containing protein [Microbacterium sp. MPKO10]|uniref:DNA-3-methyladenine glycosylase 2 n=1 Tax=Microbacterium sp. MPKO10 TaxID=2989818 RepID=UPI00223582A0|nr:AlkA N-terminal domain-containing protein [Microbacterium sp. MPKO10]MCW4456718.1 hypothetical protein [Microbacterium sp. MPKO10]
MPELPHAQTLAFTSPYDVDALLAAQRTHAVPGIDAPEPTGARHAPGHTECARTRAGRRTTESKPVDEVTGTAQNKTAQNTTGETQDAVIERGIRHHGRTGVLRVTFADDHVALSSSLPVDAALERRVRRWLDLDVDPTETAEQLGDDAVIGPLISKRPGLRILGHLDDLEAACFAVLGQQVSLASARTFQRRFVAAFATHDPATGFRHFPDAAEIAALDPATIRDAIGLTRSRAATLHTVVTELASGLTLDGDPVSIRHRLLGLKGIGPWTADYLAVRAVGDRDAFPAGDLVLRRAMGAADVREAMARGEAWRPRRAYATFHLWTEHAYCV